MEQGCVTRTIQLFWHSHIFIPLLLLPVLIDFFAAEFQSMDRWWKPEKIARALIIIGRENESDVWWVWPPNTPPCTMMHTCMRYATLIIYFLNFLAREQGSPRKGKSLTWFVSRATFRQAKLLRVYLFQRCIFASLDSLNEQSSSYLDPNKKRKWKECFLLHTIKVMTSVAKLNTVLT